MDEVSLLFAMFRNQLEGTALPFAGLTVEQLADVRRLAAYHQLSHIISACVVQNRLTDDPQIMAECRREKIAAALHIQAQETEAERIYGLLTRRGVPYIPLKGQVSRRYYPQGWMRNSRDVDILIPQDCHADICQILQQEYGYTVMAEGGHDIMFRAANGLCMEIHYRLLENNAYLDSVWDRAQPTGNGTEYRMSEEDFYLYHIFHMAKHFRNGGCGIRPVMDLWLFMKRGYRTPALNELLGQHQLLQFTQTMEQLGGVWFGGESHSPATCRTQAFLLRGGVHGDEQFYHLETLHRHHGKLGYLLSVAFPPFRKLKEQYPVLQRHPWLAPFMAIHRILRILFGKGKGSYQTQMQNIQGISKAKQDEMNALWKDVGF